jgi:hypothetical protein
VICDNNDDDDDDDDGHQPLDFPPRTEPPKKARKQRKNGLGQKKGVDGYLVGTKKGSRAGNQ